jgi:SWI/SNF-related matrix-associated actin-dependent regulator of chromatin subfamily A-like protein 1
MTLHSDGRYYLKCAFEERDIARDAGFDWNRDRKLWNTDNPVVAGRLIRFADQKAAASVEKRLQLLRDSYAIESTISVPAPPGKAYDPHQLAAIEWATRNRAVLIADEQGLGKTIEAIGVANYYGFIKILILCPASVKYNWWNECDEWLTTFADMAVVNGFTPEVPDSTNGLIVNYDLLREPKVQELLRRFGPFDLMIIDEAHYLKNPEAKRTAAVLSGAGALARLAGRHILLTGTPIQNQPVEIYALVAAFGRRCLGPYARYKDFIYRFCGAYRDRYGIQLGQASNTEELNWRLREGFMMRRLKKDVLKDLPPRRYQVIPLELDARTGEVFKKAQNADLFDNLTEADIRKAEMGVDMRRHESDTKALGELVSLRRELAELKLDACIKHIEHLLFSGCEKLIVFAHHKDIVGAIEARLTKYKPVKVSGSVSAKARQKAIDAFQKDPATRVFIGNIEAAGTGITLTAGHTLVFVESSWVPGVILQAIDRAHRRGQDMPVVAQFLVIRDTLEEYMMYRAIEKIKQIEKIVEKKSYV